MPNSIVAVIIIIIIVAVAHNNNNNGNNINNNITGNNSIILIKKMKGDIDTWIIPGQILTGKQAVALIEFRAQTLGDAACGG